MYSLKLFIKNTVYLINGRDFVLAGRDGMTFLGTEIMSCTTTRRETSR